MPRLNDIAKDEVEVFLIYGAAGSAKTEFVGSVGSKNLIINTGLGLKTLYSPGFRKRNPNSNPIVENFYEEILPDKATGFDNVCDCLDAYLDEKHKEFNNYDVISIDDATNLRRYAMAKGLEINQTEGKSKSLGKSKASGVIMKAVQDYGMEMDFIDQFLIHYISECRRKGKHFILTAHERVEYNKPSSIGDIPTINKIRPGFTGRTFPDSVTGHFDHTFHMERLGAGDQIKYFARTVGDAGLDAKTRMSGVLKILEPNPRFPEIMGRIKSGQIIAKGDGWNLSFGG